MSYPASVPAIKIAWPTQFSRKFLGDTGWVMVANLAPRKLRGFESQGMLLAASPSDDAPAAGLVTIDADVPPGSIIR